jgi:pectate lyase
MNHPDLDFYDRLFGYAQGTTGGEGGPIVTCTTGDEIAAALKAKDGDAPLIIFIPGGISGANTAPKQIDLSEVKNVTVMGDGQGEDVTGVGFRVNKGSENILFFNLKIGRIDEGGKDGIGIEGDCSRIVALHCDLYGDMAKSKDHFDGLLDTKRGAERIAAVLCKFHDHHKACLNGMSDSDKGVRKVTFALCHWDNVGSRCPSVRFGEAHVFGCLLTDVETSGINCRMGAKVCIEATTFDKVHNPVCALDSKEPGYWNLIDSAAMDCTWGKPGKEPLAIDWTSTTDFRPPYDMPALSRAQAAAIVQTFAGLLPPGRSVTLPGQGATVPQPEEPAPEPEQPAEEPAEQVPEQPVEEEPEQPEEPIYAGEPPASDILATFDALTAAVEKEPDSKNRGNVLSYLKRGREQAVKMLRGGPGNLDRLDEWSFCLTAARMAAG